GDGLQALVLFNGTNGSSPRGPLVIGQDGNLYGSALRGGLGFNGDPNSGFGTLFKITAQGLLTTLFLFNGTNGARPSALVLGTDGNFYGTTGSGGLGFSGDSWSGNGTIFRLTPEGVLTTLISFNGTNGNSPQAALLQAKDGNFCGTTAYGGEGCGLGPVIGGAGYGFGTVFKLTLSGTLTTLASGNFPLIGASEGIFPFSYPSTFRSASSLVEDRNGTLYGTTGEVDRGAGVTEGAIFRLVPRPVMTVRESPGGGIRLDWSSFTNATYRVEYKSTLGDLYWIPVMPAVTPGGNTSLQIDDIGGVPARFYRVRLVP